MMNRPLARVVAFALLVCLLLSASSATAQGPTPPADKLPLKRVPGAAVHSAGLKERVDKLTPGPDGRVRAILQLSDPPLAEKYGRASALPALNAQGKLDLKADAAKSYSDKLGASHKAVAAALAAKAPGATVDHTYRILYNGLAVSVPADKTGALADLPGVKAVHGERMRYVTMDASLPLIGAPAAWAALGGADQAGVGMKVAIVDTGIRKENPLFAGTGYSYPADGGPWPKGYCADHSDFCNGKIIAARYYTPTFEVAPWEVMSPLDIDGHGSHTAGTAAGNRGVTATVGAVSVDISGVAPRAWLMVYKGLFATEDGGGGGSNAMLVAALEDAVADGADVINNSWGGSPGDPTGDPDTIAAENAVAAGVVVVFSGGNSGPDGGSLGTPGNTPGVITVGATTTGRTFAAEARLTAPGADTLTVTGASVGVGASGPLADAEGVADTRGDRSGLALNPYPPGTFTGQIVLVRRGENARVDKSRNVAAGGAVGMILYNASDTQEEDPDLHSIPTVHVSLQEGLAVKRYLADHPGATATLTRGAPAPTTPDVVADFSSRGPNFNPELVKPDVVAPGVNIVSAGSPDNPFEPTPFQPASGTSMAAPHVAGAAALVLQKNPTFTPAQVKSALMTTAITTGIVREDGATPATVNDRGAGRIDVSRALNPGITFDKPSVGINGVMGRATREVRATNVTTGTVTYSAAAPGQVWGGRLTVTPTQFTLQAGQSISLTIGVNVVGLPQRAYDDGQINFTEVGGNRHAHLITWLRPAPPDLPREVALEVRNDAGDTQVSFTPNVDLPALDIVTFGLAAPTVTRPTVTEDPDSNPSTDPLDPAHGWTVYTYTLTSATGLFQAETSNASDSLEDVDLFLLYDANGDGRFDFPSEVIDSSRGYDADEQVSVEAPQPGRYALGLHGYYGEGAVDLTVWDVRSGGNLSATPPAGPLVAGTPASFRLAWRDVTQPGVRYLGMLRLVANDGTLGTIPVRIVRAPETELTVSVRPATVEAGRPVTYTFSVTNFTPQPTDYVLTDTLPSALRLDPASLTGWTVVPTNTVQTQFSLRARREVIDFQDSLAGETPRLRYIELPTEAGSEELPQGSSGDDVGLDFELPEGVPPFTYLGQSYTKFGLVTNGYIVPGGLQGPGDVQYLNLRLPYPGRPNPMIAPFWTDIDLGAGSSGSGTWYAEVVTGGPFGSNYALIVQWKDAGVYASSTTRLNFEVALVLQTGEVYFIYDKMDGDRRYATIGAEDAQGQQGGSWYYDGAPPSHFPTSDRSLKLLIDPTSARFATQTVSFRARPMAAGTFTDRVVLSKRGQPDRAFASSTITATAPAPVTLTTTAEARLAGYASPLFPGPVWRNDVIRAGVDPTLQRPAYYGLFQITPPRLPAGAQITQAEVTLTGLDATYLDRARGQARWNLRLLAPSVNSQFTSLNWYMVQGAPVVATLPPALTSADVAPGRTNTFTLAPAQYGLLAGDALSFRVDPELLSGDRRQIFGWDGGAGGHPPTLRLTYIPPIVELP